jgi:hypothetical protein
MLGGHAMGTYVSVKNLTLIVIPMLITGTIIKIHVSFYQFLAPVKQRIGNTTITNVIKRLPNVTVSKHITFLNFHGPINGRATSLSHV